jgi:hypothetical protein
VSKVELLKRLHPGQMRILDSQFNRTPFTLFDLSLEQRFEVMKMRVLLLSGFLRQRCKLSPDGTQS